MAAGQRGKKGGCGDPAAWGDPVPSVSRPGGPRCPPRDIVRWSPLLRGGSWGYPGAGKGVAPTSCGPGVRVAAVPVTRRAVQLVELVLQAQQGAAHPLQDLLHPLRARPCREETSPPRLALNSGEAGKLRHGAVVAPSRGRPDLCWVLAGLAVALVPRLVLVSPVSGSQQAPRPGWAKPWPWFQHLEQPGRREASGSSVGAAKSMAPILCAHKCRHPGSPPVSRATSPPMGAHRSAPAAPRPPA